MRSCLRPQAETLPYARTNLEHTGLVHSRARADNHARLRKFKAKSKTAPRQALVTAATQAVTLSKDSETDAAPLAACVPQHLSKYVAQIKLPVKGTPVQVYILGLSHVSRQSCQHAAQLIAAVTPEVVMLELCKDRVDLLVDYHAPPPQHWHSRIIDLQGMAQSSSVSNICRKLLSSLTCQRGKMFTAHDIEQACVQLLSSGLFASVQPVTQPASAADSPLFLPGNHQMRTVAPLGSLVFQVQPRHLPPLEHIQLSNNLHPLAKSLQDILQSALGHSQQGAPSLTTLTQAHERVQSCLQEQGYRHVQICFNGVETGRVAVAITEVGSAAEASITGLEGSATSGEGWGIQPFQLRSQPVPPIQQDAKSKDAASGKPTDWRPWSQQEILAAQPSISGRSSEHPSGAVNSFTNFVTQTYAKYQREAGEAVGVTSGEAWRTAFHAAAKHGASQVHLGDKPAIGMSQRMAQGIWAGTAPYLGAALLLTLATLAASASHALPSELVPVAAAAGLGVLGKGLYSVLAPLAEIRQLSRLSAPAIEAAVDLKEPLQNGSKELVKLWGEDALLSWPGALGPVIHERDLHMANTIWAAATGTAGSPAFVRSGEGCEQTWQYMMPDHAVDSDACPLGHGSGVYSPTAVQSVVAVVGSAHVRGIVAELQHMSAQAESSR